MSSFHFRTAALLTAGLALTAAPSFAQRDGRRNGDEGGRRQGIERAQPNGGDESRGRVESQRRAEPRGSVESQRRVEPNRRSDNRAYGNRSYNYRPSVNRSYRSYVRPYGYRPYGYRPGWSLNLYFGRPYSSYGYPAYAYPPGGYGYYAIEPGRAYGAVRIVDAPRDAQVFVDGNYAGVVDDYDGVFQHLNLEAGSHHIEIEGPGYPPVAFDVRVEPGQTTTYHANIR
jgi:hypothetical protein